MTRALWSSIATSYLVLAGCDATPDLAACPPTAYTQDTLDDCACGLSAPAPGLLTALVAPPGSFGTGSQVRVLFAGARVAGGVAGSDGSLALPIFLPGASADSLDLVVEYGRESSIVVHVPARQTAVVTGDLTFLESEPDTLDYAATTRAIAWIDCDHALTPTPAPTRMFAANLSTSRATVVPAAPLGAPWDVQVSGEENDLAIVLVEHEGGGVSGCFESHDVCCDCAGGGDWLHLHRAHCTDDLRSRGMCAVRGTNRFLPDAGHDAFVAHDAYFETPDAGPPPDMGPPS